MQKEATKNKNSEAKNENLDSIPTNFRELLHLFKQKGMGGEVARGSGGVFLINFVDLVLKFVLGVILARFLSADGFGVYSYVMAIIFILAIPIKLGLPSLIVKNVASFVIKENWQKLKGILFFANIAVLVGSLIILIFFFTYLQYTSFNTDQYGKAFVYGIFLIPFLGFNSLRMASLRGLRHTVLGMTPDLVIKNSMFLVLVILFPWVFGNQQFKSEEAILLNLIAVVISFLVGSYFLAKKMPSQVREVHFELDLKKWIYSAIPFLVTGGMVILNNKVDLVILGIFRSSVEVGVYEVSVRMAALIAFLYGSVNYLVSPYISILITKEQHKNLQSLLKLSVVVSFIFGLLLFLIYLIFGKQIIILLFGNSFDTAYLPLLILSLGQLINVASGSGGPLLNMSGYEKIVAYSVFASTVVNILLNIILIPKFGVIGAAYTTIFTFVIWNISVIYFSKKYLGQRTSLFQFIGKNKT